MKDTKRKQRGQSRRLYKTLVRKDDDKWNNVSNETVNADSIYKFNRCMTVKKVYEIGPPQVYNSLPIM